MKGLWRWLALVLAAGTLLAGCGSSSSSPTTATGKFVDAPTQGLNYASGSLTGVTDANGTFTYEIGQPVTFSIGGKVILGTANGQAIITPIHLAPNPATATAATPEVVNIVRTLMTLSTSSPSSGITISQAVQDAAKALGTATNVQSMDGAGLLNLVSSLDSTKTSLVTTAAATSHMSDSVYVTYAGPWSGTWAGNAPTKSGTWQVTISSTGTVSGTVPGVGSVNGSLVNGTSYSGTAGSSSWSGAINLVTGEFSGTWVDGAYSGTFTGKAS